MILAPLVFPATTDNNITGSDISTNRCYHYVLAKRHLTKRQSVEKHGGYFLEIGVRGFFSKMFKSGVLAFPLTFGFFGDGDRDRDLFPGLAGPSR